MLTPLLVAERPEGDVEKPFRLLSEFAPAGDQPQAIDELCEGLERGEPYHCGEAARFSPSFDLAQVTRGNARCCGQRTRPRGR